MADKRQPTYPALPTLPAMHGERQHNTGAIPTGMYPDHMSGAIAIASSQQPQDNYNQFANWWKTAAGIAGGMAVIGGIIWWVGTRLFVEHSEYMKDNEKRNSNQVEVQATLKNFQQILENQTTEFRQLRVQLQGLSTDLTILKTVQDERNPRRQAH